MTRRTLHSRWFFFCFKTGSNKGKQYTSRKKEPGSRVSYLRFRSSVAPLKEASEDRITGSIHPWTSAWLNMSRVYQEPPLFLRSNGHTRPKKRNAADTTHVYTRYSRSRTFFASLREDFDAPLLSIGSFFSFRNWARETRVLSVSWPPSGSIEQSTYFSRNIAHSLLSLSPSRELFIAAYIHTYTPRKRETTPSPEKWKYSQPRFFFYTSFEIVL